MMSMNPLYMQVAEQDYEKEKLNERIAKLSGGVAIIQVTFCRTPFVNVFWKCLLIVGPYSHPPYSSVCYIQLRSVDTANLVDFYDILLIPMVNA
jgi:hypothetical protein